MNAEMRRNNMDSFRSGSSKGPSQAPLEEQDEPLLSATKRLERLELTKNPCQTGESTQTPASWITMMPALQTTAALLNDPLPEPQTLSRQRSEPALPSQSTTTNLSVQHPGR
ncbi:hypothetical protein HYFRA_00001640 [Hymenoscyphus fraxineus]|uniref:Uncharacterized protein n=1 Tax=Hymenoscyphus fraxineus TaxID=746836 RepID=A0A9N9PMK2_9HELO|nr:hypothetical protein HYFRA_00001640 [Hymenoscyphus fraxineus]